MNAEFEQKLLELKGELETQRLQQVGTMKSVLERQHSNDLIELDDIHQQQMDGLRDGKRYTIPKFPRRFSFIIPASIFISKRLHVSSRTLLNQYLRRPEQISKIFRTVLTSLIRTRKGHCQRS